MFGIYRLVYGTSDPFTALRVGVTRKNNYICSFSCHQTLPLDRGSERKTFPKKIFTENFSAIEANQTVVMLFRFDFCFSTGKKDESELFESSTNKTSYDPRPE